MGEEGVLDEGVWVVVVGVKWGEGRGFFGFFVNDFGLE